MLQTYTSSANEAREFARRTGLATTPIPQALRGPLAPHLDNVPTAMLAMPAPVLLLIPVEAEQAPVSAAESAPATAAVSLPLPLPVATPVPAMLAPPVLVHIGAEPSSPSPPTPALQMSAPSVQPTAGRPVLTPISNE